jgi:large subunit ribosomal protein L5
MRLSFLYSDSLYMLNSYLTAALKDVRRKLKVENIHDVPRLKMVVVNVGVGKKREDKTYLAAVKSDLKTICGQAPQERRARKAVAGFAVREGDLVGLRVTLRGKKAADFVERLVKLALPRVRDFRGISLKGLDGRGNLSLGITEQLAFPEIRADKTDVLFGLQVTLVTSAQTNAEGEALLRALSFPLADKDE